MKTGTKSLLFGVHQVLWHPVTVFAAWVWLYGRMPSFKETVCIIVHDWGYWGKANMDDEDGERHPELGAKIAHFLCDRPRTYRWKTPNGTMKREPQYGCLHLCLFHSRHYARTLGLEPSKLCWADKCSIMFEPWWWYLPRAIASGEIIEYRKICADRGFVPMTASNRVWFVWIKERLMRLALEKRGDAVPYANANGNEE